MEFNVTLASHLGDRLDMAVSAETDLEGIVEAFWRWRRGDEKDLWCLYISEAGPKTPFNASTEEATK